MGAPDAATMASGVIVTGRFADATIDDLHLAVRGCMEAPFRFLEAMVPMRRLGALEEFAVFLDGTSGFTTGQFVPYAGGWA